MRICEPFGFVYEDIFITSVDPCCFQIIVLIFRPSTYLLSVNYSSNSKASDVGKSMLGLVVHDI